jgi:Family of unknown function (DUF5681)
MAKSKTPKPPGQYDIGYGKPPAKDQFKPGQSGNPAGCRKGQPTPNEIFMKEAARLVKIKKGDTVETITKFEAIVRRLLQLAMEGDIAAARLVFIGLAQNAPTRPKGRRRTRPQTSPLAPRRTTRLCAACWRASRICSRGKRRLIHERGRRNTDERRPASCPRGKRRTALDQNRPAPV